MRNFFKILDPKATQDDALDERIAQETKVSIQITFLALSIIFSLISLSIMTYCMLLSSKSIPRPTFSVKLENGMVKGEANSIITLPVPHQSLKNVSGWLLTALNTIYGVGFDNIDDKIKDAEYYFTPDGYKTYLLALENSGFKSDIIKKKLKITLLATQNPVLINGGSVGELEFWRLRVPVMISYLGGKEIVTAQKMVEVLIVRVPSYKNEKGLAISEFIMGSM